MLQILTVDQADFGIYRTKAGKKFELRAAQFGPLIKRLDINTQ